MLLTWTSRTLRVAFRAAWWAGFSDVHAAVVVAAAAVALAVVAAAATAADCG